MSLLSVKSREMQLLRGSLCERHDDTPVVRCAENGESADER
jgi:hypothetical protein